MTDVTSVVTVQITSHQQTDRPEEDIQLRDDVEIARDIRRTLRIDKVDVINKQLFVMEVDENAVD